MATKKGVQEYEEVDATTLENKNFMGAGHVDESLWPAYTQFSKSKPDCCTNSRACRSSYMVELGWRIHALLLEVASSIYGRRVVWNASDVHWNEADLLGPATTVQRSRKPSTSEGEDRKCHRQGIPCGAAKLGGCKVPNVRVRRTKGRK